MRLIRGFARQKSNGRALSGIFCMFFSVAALAQSSGGPSPLTHQPTLNTSEYKFNFKRRAEYPWEIFSEQGEAYLPDIFYAEKVQNTQIMPTVLKLPNSQETGFVKYEINRLIYPTLGNPNLYIKGTDDALMSVLRLEKKYYDSLGPQADKRVIKLKPHLKYLTFQKTDKKNALSFYLIKRNKREKTEASLSLGRPAPGVFRIIPEEILKHSSEGLPEEFQKRDTLRFIFKKKALGNIPPGLYDLRFEALSRGKLLAYEFQYNAVRIFPANVDRENYSVLNVADSQVSISGKHDSPARGKTFREITHDMLDEFVETVSESEKKQIKNAAFITFNGDLHNGGSPSTLWPQGVAEAYNKEASAIIVVLRKLKIPIFLTAGNHDGYVSMGHVPGPFKKGMGNRGWMSKLLAWLFSGYKRKSLQDVVHEVRSPEVWEDLNSYLKLTAKLPGGLHRDIFTGRFVRRALAKGQGLYWARMPWSHRNRVLYDGFYQWRRSYGPLYYSWNFGKNHYVSLNSFDIRQHRRSGWGMYTVNYGGGLSNFQVQWLARDLTRNKERDVTLISHHDPRGGNKGRDYPYYFKQVDYSGMGASARSFVKDEVILPVLCGHLPKWVKTKKFKYSCLKDGLQEWMRADADFDCRSKELVRAGVRVGMCEEGMDLIRTYSGYQLIHLLATRKYIRTLLLGHTHFNSLEILQPTDELVPEALAPDLKTLKRLAELEVITSLRKNAREKNGKDVRAAIIGENKNFYKRLKLSRLGYNFKRKINKHELLVMRLTTIAELTDQNASLNGRPFYGFAVFDVKKSGDLRNYQLPQINAVQFHQYDPTWFAPDFEEPGPRILLDRTKRFRPGGEKNPLTKLIQAGKKE